MNVTIGFGRRWRNSNNENEKGMLLVGWRRDGEAEIYSTSLEKRKVWGGDKGVLWG
jgi:hypothetical protein